MDRALEARGVIISATATVTRLTPQSGDEPQTEPDVRAAVIAHRLSFSYGATRILTDVDIQVGRGQILALLGPSGCGKTTLLRLIAGLLAPTSGSIEIEETVVADSASKRFLPPEARGLGMVFQDYALWPHMTVGQNVGFPLEMRGIPKAERETRIAAALERVGLKGFAVRRPENLSGGQQQRVSIARAIVAEPRLVLFDEPLSNLDKELRDNLATEIASLVRGLGLTAVYVTHDQGEAFALADQVAVMQGGRVCQKDTPEQLVKSPSSAVVAEFLGLGSLAPARMRSGVVEIDGTGLRFNILPEAGLGGSLRRGKLFLPKKALRLCGLEQATLSGRVVRSVFRGDRYLVGVQIGHPDGIELTIASDMRAHPGETVAIAIDGDQIRFFPDTPLIV